MANKNKKRNTKIYVSRFAIIFLSIILQAVGIWVVLFWLGQQVPVVYAVFVYVLSGLLMIIIVNKDQPACYKLPWIILLQLFPYGGIMIYFTFGKVSISKRQMKRYRAIYSESHDEYYNQSEVLKKLETGGGKGIGTVNYLRAVTALPVYDNSTAEYLKNGSIFFAKLESELEKAEKYIFLEYFIIDDGIIWGEIENILLRKISEGVKVYLMYDDVGSMPKVSPNFCRELCKEGIDARKFHKFIPVVSVTHNNRDHRKIAVIDGKVGFMGGANIADEYANITRPFGRWLDCSVMIKGQATDSLVRLFIQLYNMTDGTTDENTLLPENFICEKHEVYKDGFMYPFGDSPSPITEEHIGENVYLDIISRAEKYLYIATPYLITDTNLTQALKNAARRGVDVKLFVPGVPDKKAVYAMTKSTCISLMGAGVKIYEYRGGFIHSKCFLSDDDIAVIGTINLDFRSLVHHFECATLFYKNAMLNDIYADFCDLIENECDLMSPEDMELKWYEKPVKWFLTFFAPLM